MQAIFLVVVPAGMLLRASVAVRPEFSVNFQHESARMDWSGIHLDRHEALLKDIGTGNSNLDVHINFSLWTQVMITSFSRPSSIGIQNGPDEIMNPTEIRSKYVTFLFSFFFQMCLMVLWMTNAQAKLSLRGSPVSNAS
jgi:hypothetical protein